MDETQLFTIDRAGTTLIITLPGTSITFEDEQISAGVQIALKQLKDPKLTDLVIDFSQTPYFGSAILGATLVLRNATIRQKGRFAICNLSRVGLEIIKTSKFDSLWPIFDTLTESLDEMNA